MKKITNRAFSVILIALLVLGGTGFFVYKDINHGRAWAQYFAIFNSRTEGKIYDRNGVELASFKGANNTYNEDRETRIANYHVTGDYWGRTGMGVLSSFWQGSTQYDMLHGISEIPTSVMNLTIDSELNNKAYDLLSANGKGCIMIMNYRTGEVICLVSSPSIDPMYNGEEKAADEDAAQDGEEGESVPEETEGIPDGAFINRALSATFVPGSTFKLVTAAAAIETLPDLDSRTFLCEGDYYVAGVKISCTTAHGNQTFEQALANSCNCAFAQITVAIGQDAMVQHVTDYGFLSPHTFNGCDTPKGNYPTDFVGDPELAWSGIGQSVDLVCPYTMLRYVAAIANGGNLVEPYMVKSDKTPELTGLVSPGTARRLQQLMRNNVETHYEGETYFPGLKLCAKTGTAENESGNDHSWFTGYLDDENHPYAFVSIVENGGFGLWTSGMMMNELLQYAVTR